MGRSVLCDESLIQFLESISNSGEFTVGLILGQFGEQKDYVVHLPPTPLTSSDENGSGGDTGDQIKAFLKIADIKDELLSNHARVVTRMLPGGLWVLGFYIVGAGNIFDDRSATSKLKNLANAVHNCTKGNDYLCGRDPSNQKLIFHFNPQTKKFVCKTVDMPSISSSIQPVDWKFKQNITSWIKVESSINLNWLHPFTVSSDVVGTKKRMQECLKKFEERLNGFFCHIHGYSGPTETKLQDLKTQKQTEETKEEEQSFQLMFFSGPSKDINSEEEPMEEREIASQIDLHGVIRSVAFLNDKSTVGDAIKAVKYDLIRSLASRLEMHWQTFEEPNDNKSNCIIRCPPRRVLFTPEKSEVSYSEYLFDGEEEEDALPLFNENLGFSEGKLEAIEGVWETLNNDEQNEDLPPQGADTETLSSNSSLYIGVIAAGITLLLSIAIHFLYS